ncbi:hypothetical protein K438DRAFT_2071018 [Mycena galopus ATCC 62051]|nr:hypothetical protein K438DRAFT_2071018 [Mycena galopus ATCC 62051]
MSEEAVVIQTYSLPSELYALARTKFLGIRASAALDRWCQFCRICEPQPQDYEEIVDGSGGITALATLFANTIKRFILPFPIDPKNVEFLENILLFLRNFGNEETMSPALMEAGGAECFSAAAAWCLQAVRFVPDTIRTILLRCWNILYAMLPCYSAMRDAVASGLLQSILYGATLFRDDDPEVLGLSHIVTQTLPASTVYLTVLAEIEKQLRALEDIDEMVPDLKHCWIYKYWQSFKMIAEDRISLMKRQAKDIVLFKACDNTECGAIRERTEFKRCSECLGVYYCSPECQKIDWTRGDHRAACQSIRMFVFKNSNLGARNISFMRELLHRDVTARRYAHHIGRLESQQLSALRALAGANELDPFVTVMDYTHGEPTMHIDGLSRAQQRDILSHQINWGDHIARMARSGGRVELHVMVIQDGFSPGRQPISHRRMMFPQRSTSPGFHTGLPRILLENGKDVKEEVERFFAANQSMVRIH